DTLLEEDVPIYKQKEFLRDSRDQIENINFLIIVLLKLSRFDANVVEFKKEAINVKKLLMECIKNVDALREINGVNIHLKGSNNVSFIGDFKWEVEALTNIIKNAIEHSENGNVYVVFEDNNIYVKISIIDEGTGIKEKDLKHIFDRFYKSNNSTNNFGIGLSLASEIINKDNGKIDVKNNEIKGSSFIIKYYK
ncbi:sensor histidine kinase, partial [bacterium]|nr:sensor histidine kinase [bacterium]